MILKGLMAGAGPLAPLLLLGAAPPAPTQRYGTVVVHEQIYVRVTQGVRISPPVPIRWKEGKGPKCIQARMIAGYAVVAPASVDFFLRDNRRLRARLDSSCPALDYYHGFYVTPNRGQHEVRVAYVLGVEPLRRALELLRLALLAYPERLAA